MSTQIKTPEEVATLYAEQFRYDRSPEGGKILPYVRKAIAEAIEADRAQRNERIVVASADGARTWIGGDTLADLLDTINGYLADGYTPEELRIAGITR